MKASRINVTSENNKGWDTAITLEIECEDNETITVDITLSQLDDFLDEGIKLYDNVRQHSFMAH